MAAAPLFHVKRNQLRQGPKHKGLARQAEAAAYNFPVHQAVESGEKGERATGR